jgi:hypothetical protein
MKLSYDVWETGDSCPYCLHDEMEFLADDVSINDKGETEIRGVLSCPKCGWFDDMAMCYEYQVPEYCLSK